ncbi:nucleoside diphosphate kinase regulator [Asticcacaulis sp.]|uniref:nucleoside diphosphate kinase regulator n=1 Tax=Asticcacaulis sp. TaxID=1872648 RepID=UPI002B9DADE7|nr:nucleoside diphosphate kinase regulator [Asticcacaulis sp.]HTM80442.1 nucleoside diphosphate kinase regulator [Asticcacaulis sp.]
MSQTRIKSPELIRLPAIVIGEDDLDALNRLADQARGHLAAAAQQLLTELERARIVAQTKLPAKTVRMGSIVTFTIGDGQARTAELVFPDRADIAADRISILTPVGAALIGVSAGQTIDWRSTDGRRRSLTVNAVAA